jgi:hypothetical protein
VVLTVVMAVVGSDKNKYSFFVSHYNGLNRVRDLYKASITLFKSLEYFYTCLVVDLSIERPNGRFMSKYS